jgi:hypothetical protein
MATRTHTRNILLAAALLIGSTAFAAGPPAATVEVTGWILVEDLDMADAVVAIEVNGTSTTATVTENGRFNITLPVDAEAVLRFEKPGHLPKEVLVDTRNAQDGAFDDRSRRVKFAVILELERRMAGLTYPGPVGSIGFDNGGGCMAVKHDRTVVPGRKQAPMVF